MTPPAPHGGAHTAARLATRQPLLDFPLLRERLWLGNDVFRSHFFNALSMLFPVGEQYFIDCVRGVAGQARTEPLRTAVAEFVRQEATHRHIHARLNQELQAQGERNFIAGFVQWRIRVADGMAPLSKLALTAGYEHLTAVFADGLLRHAAWRQGMAPDMARLWSWHAVEEIEHKAVAFDLYQEAGGGWLRRVAWYAYGLAVFTLDVSVQLGLSLLRDRQAWRWRTLAGAAGFLFGRRGLLAHMLPRVLGYLRPSFHPWQHDNQALADDWLREHAAGYREVA